MGFWTVLNWTSGAKSTNQRDPKTAKTLKNILNILSRTFSHVNGAISKHAKEIARKTLDQSKTRPVKHFFHSGNPTLAHDSCGNTKHSKNPFFRLILGWDLFGKQAPIREGHGGGLHCRIS